jgi:hypothetical protein
MNREKLLQNPLPIDRVAARVVRAAKPERLWRPMPKHKPDVPDPGCVLAIAPLPSNALDSVRALIGKKRDRMTVIGYAADQGAKKGHARYVARCDCGNYEWRVKILRWFGTAAPDMCRECRNRAYKLRGEWNQREPAARATVPADAA